MKRVKFIFRTPKRGRSATKKYDLFSGPKIPKGMIIRQAILLCEGFFLMFHFEEGMTVLPRGLSLRFGMVRIRLICRMLNRYPERRPKAEKWARSLLGSRMCMLCCLLITSFETHILARQLACTLRSRSILRPQNEHAEILNQRITNCGT